MNVTQVTPKALFTIAKLWKQPRCPTIDEWIKKMWYLYTMEYFSAMKKNEILPFAGKWMKVKNIILSEVSQTLICSPSYADIRSRPNTTRRLDFDHMMW
jgi:hypothetical protein